MKTQKFAFLSTAAVIAGVLAGCGVNPGANVNNAISAKSSAPVYVDGNGTARRFGYKFTGNHSFSNFGFHTGLKANLPASVDLRTSGKVSPVYDQGQLGSCTAFAMGKGLRETLTNMAGGTASPVSALYLYYKERELRGSVNEDSGAMMTDGMEVLKNSGDCLDATMPYDISKFKVKPTAAAEKEAANLKITGYTLLNGLDELKASLAEGKPAVFGYVVYKSFMSPIVASTGKMPMPKPGEQVLGGHAVFIVGYDDAQKVLIIKNSWGKGWGDKGYFYMPYDYVTADRVDEIYNATATNR